jgi:hypothetical protein
MTNLPATTSPTIPTSGLLSDERLNELLLSGDSPVVGPNTAAKLVAFAAEPEPPLATEQQVETMIGKLAMATAQAKVSAAEAEARIELYWLALRDVPLLDLRAGFMDLLRDCTFLPTPAEVRRAAQSKGAVRRYAKSRAGYLARLHREEWKPSGELVPPEEVRALLASVKIDA